MLVMTPRQTKSKILLVADPRVGAAGVTSSPIRRYRIARLRHDARPANGGPRSPELKSVDA